MITDADIHDPRECECGRPKFAGNECCSRCLYLDGPAIRNGSRSTKTDAISALRGTDGLSLREICEVLRINSEVGNGQRGLHRQIMKLLRAGRVRRYWRDNDAVESVGSVFGVQHRRKVAQGCWVYVLDGKTEREWAAA